MMSKSLKKKTFELQDPSNWLLFLHRISAKQNAARVAVWRQLKTLGALPLKTSGHLLPDSPENLERFQWLAQLVKDRGGEGSVMRVANVDGLTSSEIIHLFQEIHSDEYALLKDDVSKWIQKNTAKKQSSEDQELKKLVARFEAVRGIDFFASAAGHKVQILMQRAQDLRFNSKGKTVKKLDSKEYQGKTWLTRPRPHIDRVGSAWLISRFIDREARFVFGFVSSEFPDAIPFDMLDVEFSHHGEDCTFETLLKRFGIDVESLNVLSEMVHEADLSDGKFARVECIGLDRVFKGWAFQEISDEEILAKGFECFEALQSWIKRQ